MVNLIVNVFDDSSFPTLTPLDPTGISITIGTNSAVTNVNTLTTSVSESSYITVLVTKEGYTDYFTTIAIENSNVTIVVAMTPISTQACSFISITEGVCHQYTITNSGTTSDQNVTYSIVDLDYNPVTGYTNIPLNYGNTSNFTSTSDNVYIVIFRDQSSNIICNMIIMDLCSIMSCITNKLKDILCDCDCKKDKCHDFCKDLYDLDRILVLGFDLLNRVNREYRLNSFYSTIDEAKIYELKTAKDVIDKLNSYCFECMDSQPASNTFIGVIKKDCGCS
jgi:hypothetical protein